MRYCPDCGTGHECDGQETGREKAEVAIERLRTQRDIEVARINASAGVQVAETEAEHETAHAEGVVEGIEAVLDAASGEAEPPVEEAPVGEPIVVDTEPAAEEEPVVEPPPEAEPAPPAAKSNGWWANYR